MFQSPVVVAVIYILLQDRLMHRGLRVSRYFLHLNLVKLPIPRGPLPSATPRGLSLYAIVWHTTFLFYAALAPVSKWLSPLMGSVTSQLCVIFLHSRSPAIPSSPIECHTLYSEEEAFALLLMLLRRTAAEPFPCSSDARDQTLLNILV